MLHWQIKKMNVHGLCPLFMSVRASPRMKKVAQVFQMPVPPWIRRQALTPSSAAIDPALKGNVPLNTLLASPSVRRSAWKHVESLPPSPMQSISFS